MKGAYKQRGEQRAFREDGRHATRKRNLRRQRRLLGLAAILCALLAVVFVNYLLSEDEAAQGGLVGGSSSEEPADSAAPQGAVGDQEEAAVEEEASAGEPSVLLGQFRTDYAWDPNEGRQANLRMASGAIDKTLLAPGEEFSAIEMLEGLDYEAAKVFANGGVDYEIGGGLCQVSSTLYMAANYAGLEITERNQHYAELPYIRPGLDATVWFGENGWGALDMKFRNNTNGDILIREWVDDKGFLNAQIYGEEPSGKQVSMNSEKTEEDLSKGITWATYKTVTDDSGNVVEDGLLYESTYSYNPPVPPELKYETDEPRVSGWLDTTNTTNWNSKKN